MGTVTHWKDWEGYLISDGEGLIQQDIYDLGEYLYDIEQDGQRYFYGTIPTTISFHKAESVAKGLYRDSQYLLDIARGGLYSIYHNFMTAENIAYWGAECFYDGCEYEIEEDVFNDVRGIEDLQYELDKFYSANESLFKWRVETGWYSVKPYLIGIGQLEKALKKMESLNTHHKLYYPDPKNKIELDDEFWAMFQ